LDNAIQRALILQSGQWISGYDLGLSGEHLIDFEAHRDALIVASGSTDSNVDLPAMVTSAPGKNEGIHADMKHREFELILNALRVHSGRKNRAADHLGISSRTLRYKLARMRELGMDVDSAIAGIR